MQTADVFPKGMLPPVQGGGAPETTRQFRNHQIRQRRILRQRTVQFWWYPVLLVVLGGITAAILGQFALDLPKEIWGGVFGVPLVYLAVRYPQFGLLLAAICVSPFMPSALKVSSLYISPAIPLILLLLFIVLVRTAFLGKKPVFLSLWTTWPLIGLILMAILSEMIAQATWLYVVPHKVLNNPIVFEESIGVALYFAPLIVVFTVTTILTKKDKWIQYILYVYLVLALIDAAVIIIEFKHIGADIYAFRYASPSIGWMPLEALAQLLSLGCIIAYAQLLYASRWRARIICGAA